MTRTFAPWFWTPLVLITLFLAVVIIRDGLANWAVEERPGHALDLAPEDPRALAGAADDALAALKTPADAARVETLARQALTKDPTEVDALRDLGLIAAERGQIATAYRRLDLAADRSPLDGPSHYWRMKYRLLTGDDAGAFEDADDLLRHDPDRLSLIAPNMMAAAGPGAKSLIARLATNPPWRGAFVKALMAQARDPTLAFAILEGLAQARSGPTTDEEAAYFGRRLADHAYQTAYLDWLQLLPPGALAKATAVYDGDFQGLPGAPPFNWSFGSGIGGEARIAPSPDGAPGTALDVRYDGYATPDLADQLLALAPGVYRLTGLTHATGDAADALAWTLRCAEGPTSLTPAPTPTPAAAGWRDFSVTFTVPDSGCEGQWLTLTPLPAGHERSLEIWYRGLAIRPA